MGPSAKHIAKRSQLQKLNPPGSRIGSTGIWHFMVTEIVHTPIVPSIGRVQMAEHDHLLSLNAAAVFTLRLCRFEHSLIIGSFNSQFATFLFCFLLLPQYPCICNKRLSSDLNGKHGKD